MLIQLNDRFTLERDIDCWCLTEKQKHFNKKLQKYIETESKKYCATLIHCCEKMLEQKAADAKTLAEIINEVKLFKRDVLKALGGIDIAGYPRGSEEKERGNRRSKTEDSNQSNDHSDEGKGAKRKVRTRLSSKSKEVSNKEEAGIRTKRGGNKKKT